jgi:hypothetical protein
MQNHCLSVQEALWASADPKPHVLGAVAKNGPVKRPQLFALRLLLSRKALLREASGLVRPRLAVPAQLSPLRTMSTSSGVLQALFLLGLLAKYPLRR